MQLPPPPSPPTAGSRGDDLLGRTPELETIDTLISRVAAGEAEPLLLSGEIGVGKTTLLRAARARFDTAGVRVLQARGTPLERAYGYGAARQLFDGVLRELRDDDDALWAGSAALARPVFDDFASPTAPETDGSSFARHQGLYWLLVNLIDRLGPVALVIDDAQWIDEPTLAFLCHLVLRVDGLPLALVIGTRPITSIAGGSALEELAAGITSRTVGPLGPADVAAWVEQRWGPASEAFAQTCHELTGGVPLLVRELIDELRGRAAGAPPPAALPTGLKDVGVRTVAARVQRELRGAGDGSLRLARSAAVLGDDVPTDLALALAGVAPTEGTDALLPLVRTGILTEEGGLLRFVHAVVHASVSGSIPATERAAMHRAAAEHLHRTRPGDRRIAGHLLECPAAGDAWAADALRAAARRATAVGSPAEAARLLRRAAEESAERDAALQWELARALSHAGDAAGLEHYAAALEAAVGSERVEIALDYSGALMMSAKTDAAFALLDGELAGHEAPAPARAGLHALALFARSSAALAYRSVRTADAEMPTDPATAAVAAYEAMIRTTPAGEIVPLLDVAFAGQGFPTALAASPAYGYGVLALIATDHLELALSELRRQGAAARSAGAVTVEALVDCLRACALGRRGLLAEAEGAALASLARADEPAWQFGRVSATLFLVHVLIDQGRVAEARDAIDAVPATDLAVDSNVTDMFEHARAVLHLEEGRPEVALPVALAVGERLEAWGATNPALVPWRSTAALAASATGDPARAEALAREELALAERGGSAAAMARALTAMATVVSPVDQSLLSQAAGLAREAGTAVLEARALLALGRAQRIAGNRSEARETLREAQAVAQRCGARGLHDAALDEIAASGGRPRARDAAGSGALTGSEARIARLAASGRTNREIAQQLYLSQKTIEMHLGSVYRKLGVPGRAHLAAQLGPEPV